MFKMGNHSTGTPAKGELAGKLRRKRKSGIQRKLLLAVIPLFILSFAIMMGMAYLTSSKMLTESTKRALYNEAQSNSGKVTINLLINTGCSTIHAAYVRINLTPAVLKELYDETASFKVMNAGYSFMINNETLEIVAHPDKTIRKSFLTDYDASSFLGQVAALTVAGNTNVTALTDDKTIYYTVLSYIEETPWVLVSCIPEELVISDVRSLLTNMLWTFLIILPVVIVIVSLVIRSMIRPIKSLTNILMEVTDGDFTVPIYPKGSDEVTVMSCALKEFVEIMKEVISDIITISGQLNSSSETTKQVAGTLSSVSHTQAESMVDIKFTLDQIAQGIQELAQHAVTLSGVVASVNDNSRHADKNMNQAVKVAEQGRTDMETAGQTMRSIVSSIKQLEEVVKRVGSSTQQINSMVNLISDIADQTNLLSLNAAIEAARAGETGRGFAVVADEIRKLADESSASASNITQIISQVNKEVSVMVSQTSQSVSYIEENSDRITSACEIFQHIYKDVNDASHILSDISQQIAQVDYVASNIATLSQEQSSSAEEILASTEILAENALQFTSDSKQVSENANAVTDASFTLTEHMKRFKI